MGMKKYMDIERLKPTFADGFEVGDYIVIQEKIDGANFSIKYDEETDSIKAFSRKTELNFSNTLRGAWNWSQTLDKKLVQKVLGNSLILFGEWLVPHTVKYPDDKYNKAYFYDVYDTEEEIYISQQAVENIVNKLGLTYVPVFFDGQFTSWDDVNKYVGKTEMGGEQGEGIVVKNQTKLNNPNTRLPFYTKIVTEQFTETKAHRGSKPVDINEMNRRTEMQALTETIVTEARVRKLLNKMVDDGLIPENWDEHDMSTIARSMGKEIYYDCVKEENEVVKNIGSLFGKYANSTAMKHVRDILRKEH